MDMETLFETVNQLSGEERARLLSYLITGDSSKKTTEQDFVFDLFPGAIKTDDSFDDPLPDSFWLGQE